MDEKDDYMDKWDDEKPALSHFSAPGIIVNLFQGTELRKSLQTVIN
jgi:hypothetical protein